MKRLINCWGLATLLLLTANALTACSDDDPTEEKTETPALPSDEGEGGNEENTDDNNGNNNELMERNITISANGTSFSATLEDNDAARAFAAMLPLTLDMNEMNGNEKYHYLVSGQQSAYGKLPAGNYPDGRPDALWLVLRCSLL